MSGRNGTIRAIAASEANSPNFILRMSRCGALSVILSIERNVSPKTPLSMNSTSCPRFRRAEAQ